MSGRKGSRVRSGGHQVETGEQKAQAWMHARAGLEPGLLTSSPPWVRGVFDHSWAPMSALANQIRCLPGQLWEYLVEFPGGLVTISTKASRYVAGATTIKGRPVQNVAIVSVQDLATQNEQPLHVIGHLVDHYMGCGGDSGGAWLSEGGGMTPEWRETGERLHSLFALGYGVDDVAQSGPADYFAQSLAWYCRDRRRLNVADPQIHKWFRSTLWNEAFWRLPVRQERE